MTKKLIGFIAGTWGGGSNVRRLVSALRPTDDHGSDQISYYDHGVGGMRGIRRQIAGATGLGISRLNKELYSWLSHRFLPDDQIFLFGFSRGAYGVRSLAGLISRCGIVRSVETEAVNEAFRLYEYGTVQDQLAFKEARSYPRVKIQMIGVWDTVGSLGMPTRILERLNPFRSDFHYVALNPDICSAYHALAVDEERKHFLPTLWQEKDVGGEQRLEQVWFVGCHGDVGGQEMGVDHALSDITLLWMMQKAQEQGLAFKPEAIDALRPRHDGEIHDSRAVLGRLWPRRVRTIPLAKQTWIHSSVMQRAADTQLNPRYAPSALGQIGEVARLCTIVNS